MREIEEKIKIAKQEAANKLLKRIRNVSASLLGAGILAIASAPILAPYTLDHTADEWFDICNPEASAPQPDLPEGAEKANGKFQVRLSTPEIELGQLPGSVKYIGIMDTNHADANILVGGVSDPMLMGFEAADVRNLFLEFTPAASDTLRRFLNNEIGAREAFQLQPFAASHITDPTEKFKAHERFLMRLYMAADSGIEIHLVDAPDNVPLDVTNVYWQGVLGRSEMMTEQCGTNQRTDRGDYYYRLSRTWMTPIFDHAVNVVTDERVNEIDIGQQIEQITNESGGRSAIMYGAKHFIDYPTTFKTYLEGTSDDKDMYLIKLYSGEGPAVGGVVHKDEVYVLKPDMLYNVSNGAALIPVDTKAENNATRESDNPLPTPEAS